MYGFESGRTRPVSVLVPEDLFLFWFLSPKVTDSFGDVFWCHFFASYTTSASESELNVDLPRQRGGGISWKDVHRYYMPENILMDATDISG